MPFEYGMPSEEFGPDSALTLSPTFRSADKAVDARPAASVMATKRTKHGVHGVLLVQGWKMRARLKGTAGSREMPPRH